MNNKDTLAEIIHQPRQKARGRDQERADRADIFVPHLETLQLLPS